MKKICAVILTAAISISIIPQTLAAEVDYTDTLTMSAYSGDGVWWDHSDAEVVQENDYIIIKNADNNSSYSAVDVANAALGGEYENYTAEDYANLANSGTDVQALVRSALNDDTRTLGKTNHGLFSNEIPVSTQSTQICFTAKFDEAGAFVEISNDNCYAPYINTDNGNITVNTGYANDILLENFDTNKWYTFKIVLHDGREENPVASGSVTIYDADDTSAPLGTVDNLKLHYTEVEWYKVNFFPNSKYGAQMELKDFSVTAYDGETPTATPKPEKTPYPTLKPTPTPTPRPEGAATPKPTLNPQPIEGARSKNVYNFHEDFEPYINYIGTEIVTDKFSIFDATATVGDDDTNSKFINITNSKTGIRYIATADDKTTMINTKAVTQMKVKFNDLKAKDNGNVAMFDLTSSSAHNSKSDDTRLVIAERITVGADGKVKVGETEIALVSIGKWYTIKSVSDTQAKKNSIYIYDENGTEVGKIENSDYYDNTATGIKNIRFNIGRDTGKGYSVDDVYMYELKDESTSVFADVKENDAPLINYLASLGIVGNYVKITAVYTSDNVLKNVYFNTTGEPSKDENDIVKTFVWNSLEGMRPVSAENFDGEDAVSAYEVNKMIKTATETHSELTGDITREKFYSYLVDIYKLRSGDDEPITEAPSFSDNSAISDTAAIGTAVKLGLTPIKSGTLNPNGAVSRHEAVQAVSRLISAINVGITNKIVPEPEEEIIIPHVIDQLPETGVMRDLMVLNAPDGYYYMCCSTGTSPDNAKGEAFPRDDISDESLWKDDTGIRIWRSADLIDWEPVKSAKEDSEYPYYIWNVYEGGTWEKVNGFGVGNINNGEKRFAQVLWAPEIHWIKGTYFIVYCMNPGGTSIARSVSGKPEGPYVRQECSQDTLLNPRIDASLFWDDDNEVYYTDGSCAIWHLNSDMSAIVKKSNGELEYISAQAPGKEGGFLFKHNEIYYATAGEFDEKGGYDAVVGMNKTGKCLSKGTYGEVHWLYTLGHNGYFEDKEGNWWATMFGNDNDKLANETNGFNNGFALVPIDFDPYTGKIIIDTERLTAWTDLLQQHGYSFAK